MEITDHFLVLFIGVIFIIALIVLSYIFKQKRKVILGVTIVLALSYIIFIFIKPGFDFMKEDLANESFINDHTEYNVGYHDESIETNVAAKNKISQKESIGLKEQREEEIVATHDGEKEEQDKNLEQSEQQEPLEQRKQEERAKKQEQPKNQQQPKKEQPKQQKKPVEERKEEKPKQKTPVEKPTQPAPTKPVTEEPPKQKTPKKTSPISEFERQVVQLTNAERAKAGLTPFQIDEELSMVAREKSRDMAVQGYFSHTSPTYGSPFDMMKAFGITYSWAGENIAYGQRSPEEVVKAWMNSPGHRENIMNPNFTHIGVGYVETGNFWTQMFIGK